MLNVIFVMLICFGVAFIAFLAERYTNWHARVLQQHIVLKWKQATDQIRSKNSLILRLKKSK